MFKSLSQTSSSPQFFLNGIFRRKYNCALNNTLLSAKIRTSIHNQNYQQQLQLVICTTKLVMPTLYNIAIIYSQKRAFWPWPGWVSGRCWCRAAGRPHSWPAPPARWHWGHRSSGTQSGSAGPWCFPDNTAHCAMYVRRGLVEDTTYQILEHYRYCCTP